MLVAAGRPGEARPLLERGRAADPDNMRLRAALGLACLAEGDHDAAFGHLHAALEGSFDHASLAGPFIAAAQRAQRLAEAAPLIRAYADFYPGNLELSCMYARLLAATGYLGEAVERLETVLAFEPGHEEAVALLAELQRDLGE